MKPRMRICVASSALLIMMVVPFAANAVPITYRFDMPAFIGGSLAGQTSILDVIVDNGNASAANQSYLNTQIIGLSVTVGSLFLSLTAADDTTLYLGSQVYVTTDGSEIPVLDLSAVANTRATFSIVVCCDDTLQLGTRDGNGPTAYFVKFGDDSTGQAGTIGSTNLMVTGSLLAAVPEPGTLGLLGAGLLGLFMRRKRVA